MRGTKVLRGASRRSVCFALKKIKLVLIRLLVRSRAAARKLTQASATAQPACPTHCCELTRSGCTAPAAVPPGGGRCCYSALRASTATEVARLDATAAHVTIDFQMQRWLCKAGSCCWDTQQCQMTCGAAQKLYRHADRRLPCGFSAAVATAALVRRSAQWRRLRLYGATLGPADGRGPMLQRLQQRTARNGVLCCSFRGTRAHSQVAVRSG